MATKKKELNPETEQQIEAALKQELEAAYLRGLKAGCKTIAAACLETISKNKSKAVYQITQLCKKTMGLPEDKSEVKKEERITHESKINNLKEKLNSIKAQKFALDDFLAQNNTNADVLEDM